MSPPFTYLYIKKVLQISKRFGEKMYCSFMMLFAQSSLTGLTCRLMKELSFFLNSRSRFKPVIQSECWF